MNIKYTLSAVAGFVALVVLWLIIGYTSVLNGSQQFEAQIPAQLGVCHTRIDSGYQSIVGQHQVAQEQATQIHQYLQDMFDASLEPDGDAVGAQSNLIATMAKFNVLGTTDLNELQRNVQNTIAATFADWANCIARLNDIKVSYYYLLGATPGAIPGQSGSFPNSMYANWIGLPRQLSQGSPLAPRKDLDGDGKLTVFDYPSVIVSGLTADSVENGVLPTLPISTPAR